MKEGSAGKEVRDRHRYINENVRETEKGGEERSRREKEKGEINKKIKMGRQRGLRV